MKPVKVYVWTTCPFCVAALRLLDSKNINYEKIVLDGDDEGLQKLRAQTNHRTVPQIFIGDEFIGGFDDLKMLDSSGELSQKLQS